MYEDFSHAEFLAYMRSLQVGIDNICPPTTPQKNYNPLTTSDIIEMMDTDDKKVDADPCYVNVTDMLANIKEM
jgi:hypothetical protein